MTARVMSRALSLLVSFALLVPIGSAGAVEPAVVGDVGSRWGFNRTERCIMNKINRMRRKHGRSALKWDKQVGVVARRHAKSMAANYSVFHDYNMDNEITNWKSLAQNSGSAGSCKRAFWAFMRSSAHKSNMLGRWRHMGVGVDKRNGRVFVQQVFEWERDPGNIYRYP